MECPRDHHQLASKRLHGHVLDDCGQCGGCYIPKGTLDGELALAGQRIPGRLDYSLLPVGMVSCPADGTPMRALVHEGVEIDLCPACEGVWLDAGELDAIISRQQVRDAEPWKESIDDLDCTTCEPEAEAKSKPVDLDTAVDVDSGIEVDAGSSLDGVFEFIGDALGSVFDGF